jgi:alkylhydroperoxidase family enzyme
VTLVPDDVGADDVDRLTAAGVSDEAVEDALGVAMAFNAIDRIADTLGFVLHDARGWRLMARRLLDRGYL